MEELNYLLKFIRSELTAHREFIARDNCKDYAHYKYLCGLIRGLEVAEQSIIDLAEKMKDD
jgi:hypothetical protein